MLAYLHFMFLLARQPRVGTQVQVTEETLEEIHHLARGRAHGPALWDVCFATPWDFSLQ